MQSAHDLESDGDGLAASPPPVLPSSFTFLIFPGRWLGCIGGPLSRRLWNTELVDFEVWYHRFRFVSLNMFIIFVTNEYMCPLMVRTGLHSVALPSSYPDMKEFAPLGYHHMRSQSSVSII